MTTPDAELLRRYVEERAEDAFAELVRRHLNLVYFAACRRTGEPHLSEDVAQYVFTALARDAASLSHHTVLTGWLYTTTRFAAAKLLRTERRRRAREQEAYIMQELSAPIASHTSASAADWDRVRPVVDAALDELGDHDREAVLLRFFEGRPFAEIGAALRVTEDAARMRVERALEKLRVLLARRGVTSTSTALGVALGNQSLAASVPAGLAVNVANTALASATAVSVATPMAGLLGLMSTSKIVVSVAAVLGLAGIGSAIYENTAVRRAESGLTTVSRERDGLRAQMARIESRMRDAEQRAQASEGRVLALQKEVEAANQARGSSRAVNSTVTASANLATAPVTSNVDPMLSNPEYFRLSMEKYRSALKLQFGPLYKALQLSPEQIARFEDNRTQAQQAAMEVLSAATAQGLSAYAPGLTTLMAPAMGELEKELRDLLGGDAGYQQYSQYSRTKTARDFVVLLAGNVYSTETPLSTQQGEQLVQMITSNTRTAPTVPGSKVVRKETDWTAVAEQGRGLLSGTQAAAFQSLLEEKKLQEQMSALSRSGGSAATPPSSGSSQTGPAAKPGS